jgi:hypothetical protein
MTTHKLETAVYAQGWINGQIEYLVEKAAGAQAEDPSQLVIVTQLQEQWNIVSTTLDEVIREVLDLRRKLSVIGSVFK